MLRGQYANGDRALSRAGAATSIVFVATSFVATSMCLLLAATNCGDKTFVATNIYTVRVTEQFLGLGKVSLSHQSFVAAKLCLS